MLFLATLQIGRKNPPKRPKFIERLRSLTREECIAVIILSACATTNPKAVSKWMAVLFEQSFRLDELEVIALGLCPAEDSHKLHLWLDASRKGGSGETVSINERHDCWERAYRKTIPTHSRWRRAQFVMDLIQKDSEIPEIVKEKSKLAGIYKFLGKLEIV